MKCLKCEKEFIPKRETAKFCSTNCRVKWHVKNKDATKSIQDKVVEKELLETIAEFKELIKTTKINFSQITPSSYDGAKNTVHYLDEVAMFPKKPLIRRSFENYQQLKLDCESIEAWEILKSEILVSDLSSKQKALLTS